MTPLDRSQAGLGFKQAQGRIVSLKLPPFGFFFLGVCEEMPPFCADYALMNS